MNYMLKTSEVVTMTAVGATSALFVKEGCVWLTMSGDPRDYILERGDRLPLGGAGSYILEALVDATFMLERMPEKGDLALLQVNLRLTRTSLVVVG